MPFQNPPSLNDPTLDKFQNFLELTRRYGIIVLLPLLIIGWGWRESQFAEREKLRDEREQILHAQNLACREEITREVKALSASQFTLLKEVYESQANQAEIKRQIQDAVQQIQKARR